MSTSCLSQANGPTGGLKNRITNGPRGEEEEETHDKYSRDSHLEVTRNMDTGKLNYKIFVFFHSSAS